MFGVGSILMVLISTSTCVPYDEQYSMDERLTRLQYKVYDESLMFRTAMSKLLTNDKLRQQEDLVKKTEADNLMKSNALLKEQVAELRRDADVLSKRVGGSWICFSTSCYIIFTAMVNWDQAREKCLEQGAFLAEIETIEEREFLKKMVKDRNIKGNDGVWLGATDKDTEGTWIWDQSDKAVTKDVEDWHESQPNDGTRANCLYMCVIWAYEWADRECSSATLPYICEKVQ